MSEVLWEQVDDYICDTLFGADPILESVLAVSDKAGLPKISVSRTHGKLLHLLARMGGARKILEVGTLGGYSAICLARALPAGGRLITLEADAHHAEVARANFERAQLSHLIDLRLGPAIATLPKLAEEGQGPFDLVFIDADKESNADYFKWALALSRPGTLIIVDNVIRAGKVIDASSGDPMIRGVRRLNEAMAAEQRVSVTEIQTVGAKGYDGFALALVKE
jgi:predicted O-methyltransferase YrrM